MDKSHNKEQIDDFIKRTHRGPILKNVNNHPINDNLGNFLNESNHDEEKYLSIYDECLSKKYFNPSLGPLHELLYKIIIGLESELKRSVAVKIFKNEHLNDDIRAEYVRDLTHLFMRIVKDKRESQVYPACKLIFDLNFKRWLDLLIYLKTFFYPKEAYDEENYRYHELLGEIVTEYVYKKNNGYECIDEKDFDVLDSDFIKILDMYREYHSGIRIKDSNDFKRVSRFSNYVENFIAYYYKEKYDISLFPKVLDYIFANVYQLDAFRELNNPKKFDFNNCYYIEEACINRIMDACTKDIPIIK